MPEPVKQYQVTVDSSGLVPSPSGPLFERYTVGLLGILDRHWAQCYESVIAASPPFARFRLEPGDSRVTFTCRATDGPVQVMAVLNRLEALVERVNTEATAAARSPAQRPGGTAPPGGQKPASATAGGLFARFARR